MLQQQLYYHLLLFLHLISFTLKTPANSLSARKNGNARLGVSQNVPGCVKVANDFISCSRHRLKNLKKFTNNNVFFCVRKHLNEVLHKKGQLNKTCIINLKNIATMRALNRAQYFHSPHKTLRWLTPIKTLKCDLITSYSNSGT